MKREKMLFAALVLFSFAGLWSEGSALEVKEGDFLITQTLEGGYYLWVKAVPGLGSIIITESTEDPDRGAATYALRNPGYHPANGDEKRMLDGKFLVQADFYSLIDSTPEEHPELGPSFRIFIPYIVTFGNPDYRSGEMQILDGAYLNIRAVTKPYADYSDGFRDNPFILRVSQKIIETTHPVTDIYMSETVKAYTGIAREGGGMAVYSVKPEDITGHIMTIIDKAAGKSLDLVVAIDTTQSMHDDIPLLRRDLVPALRESIGNFSTLRVGIVLYKDYFEEYVTRCYPFQPTLDTVQRILDRIRVFGGKDIPEAVFEALYSGIHEFDWSAENRMIILVGDAPPHPRPRRKITPETVYLDARNAAIELHTIILPH